MFKELCTFAVLATGCMLAGCTAGTNALPEFRGRPVISESLVLHGQVAGDSGRIGGWESIRRTAPPQRVYRTPDFATTYLEVEVRERLRIQNGRPRESTTRSTYSVQRSYAP